jgi:multidrug transporter EmrE-like cation transporter
VSVSVEIGLLLAVATALTSIVGFLLKHRGAAESPPVEARRPVSSSLALFRSRAYTVGIIVATGSWGLHVAALALAPISLVQTVIAGGLALLTVVADRVFGHSVKRREWIGVALIAVGLAFLAATMSGVGAERHSDYAPATLAAYVGVVGALGLAAALGGGRVAAGGPLLAVSAGLLWGASDVSIKALSGHLDNGPFGWIHPLAVVILVASLVGLAVSARSLQVGDAVPVIALTSATANLCTIAAGPAVFGEPLPGSALGLTVRVLAFVLVIVASALTPPPLRDGAARSAPDPA